MEDLNIKIAELEATIAEKVAENAALRSEIEDKDAEFVNAETLSVAKIAALETAIAEGTTENQKLKVALGEAKKEVGAKSSMSIKPLSVIAAPSELFTVKGKKYVFTDATFTLDGKSYTAAEALKNDELCADIVKRELRVCKSV